MAEHPEVLTRTNPDKPNRMRISTCPAWLAIPALTILGMLSACGGGSADTTAPTATIVLSPRAVLGGGSVTATVSFSEDVNGLTISDLVVSGGTVGAFTRVNARTYTLAITAGGAGTTTVDVDVVAEAGRDAANNGSRPASGQAAVAFAPWASATGSDAYGVWADLTVTGNGETAVQRFRLIAPGTFTMGSPAREPGRNQELAFETESEHQVTLTTPYWFADSECTQRMEKAVTNTRTSDGLDLPLDSVTYDGAQSFLTALNLVHTNLSARLPTESEWEYAARAGTTSPFSLSPVTTNNINCGVIADDTYISTGTDRIGTVVIKSLPPNPWGLYEVHGNVWEWCADWYQNDWGTEAVTDPVGPASGTYRVVRGGFWGTHGWSCRSSARNGYIPSTASHGHQGFRLAAPGRPGGSG